jgi:AraC-like DNA-binding protein
MRYREVEPCPPLRPYVRCIWVLEDLGARGPGAPDRILPDGCVEMVLHYGDRFLRHRDGVAPSVQPRSVVVGQITRFLVIQAGGAVGMIGVRFEPGGASAFFRPPMAELRGRTLEVSELWGVAGRELEARVHEAADDRERIALVEDALLRRLAAHAPRPSAVDVAVDAIVRTGGRVTVADLAARLGVGRRRLERGFAARVGVPPKLLCRLVRFQRVFAALESGARPAGPSRWATVALECGYYDQAHLIRDFRAFAGQSPTRYLEREHAIADHFFGA